MYSDLPPELHKEISEYFTPCEQAVLAQVDSEARGLIYNEQNYDATARRYGLPLPPSRSPLRHLCHYYQIVKDRDVDRYYYLVSSAIAVGDHHWFERYGLDFVREIDSEAFDQTPYRVVEFLVNNNDLKGLTEYADMEPYMDIAHLVLTYLGKGGTPEIYEKFLSSDWDCCVGRDITRIASHGNEDLINYLVETRSKVRPCRVLAGYLIGNHHDLYHKYSQIYGVQECFNMSDISEMVEHGNLRLLRELKDMGLYDDINFAFLSWTSENKSGNNAEILDFLIPLVRPTNVRIDGESYRAASEGNHELFVRLLDLLDGPLQYIEPLIRDIEITNMINNFEGYRLCVRDLVSYFQDDHPELKDDLMNSAITFGNLELIDILEEL